MRACRLCGQYPLAGKLHDLFMGINAVGSDVLVRGNSRTGPVPIDNMLIAGF
ncbi:MAG: hypothetical protein WBO34_11240 [Gammaproteobacteria bacterium]